MTKKKSRLFQVATAHGKVVVLVVGIREKKVKRKNL